MASENKGIFAVCYKVDNLKEAVAFMESNG
jgi:hypothetical protein